MSLVLYEVKDQVGVITINRPKALNALNSEVFSELNTVIHNVDTNEVRCLIITGAGEKSFVAGADIAEMSTMTKAQAEAYGNLGNNTFLAIEKCPVPVIAAVNGYALGGGNELCLSCDIRICSENAVFGLPETSLGITPGFGGTQRLARAVGIGIAKEMLYTANRINAYEALRIGLVNHVYPQSEFMDMAMKMAKKIASNAPIAVRNCKKATNDGISLEISKAVVVEEKLFGACFETTDQIEGMKAFLEKRKEKVFINK